MAQSGSYNHSTTRDTLIADAHLYIGAIGEGETPSANQVTEAARMLNMIVKLRAADGMQAWALRRGAILPFTGTNTINTNSHVVTAYETTTISADEASGQTAISVTDGADFADNDQIGIELDNGDMHWTTISSGGGTNTLTIASAITSAAASGNMVYGYTATSDRVQKPLRILEANLLNISSNARSTINIVSREEYYSLGNLTSEGTPNQLYYTIEPSSLVALDTNGQISIYPRFSNGDQVIEFTYHRPFQDFDASGDEPDFPQAFYLPLVLELACLLAPKFGIPMDERSRLMKEAQYYMEQALWTVAPGNSVYIVPDRETE